MCGKWTPKHKNQSTAQEPSAWRHRAERPGGTALPGFSPSLWIQACPPLCTAVFPVTAHAEFSFCWCPWGFAHSSAHPGLVLGFLPGPGPQQLWGVSKLDTARLAGLSLFVWLSYGGVCFPGHLSRPLPGPARPTLWEGSLTPKDNTAALSAAPMLLAG